WSPFEHCFITWEIETSKAIAIQLLRHRSNYFQEFSQRYQDVRVLDKVLEPIELRKQAIINRQSSTEPFDPTIELNIPSLVIDGETGFCSGTNDKHNTRLKAKASFVIDWYQ